MEPFQYQVNPDPRGIKCW